MKKILLILGLTVWASWAMAAGVYFYENVGDAANGRIVLATTTATKVTMSLPINRTLVVVNEDPENVIFYGGSNCSQSAGQRIAPGEKVTFQGVTAGFTFYVCTANGSAELRMVSHS